MRFLFVYHHYAEQARQLLEDLDVDDVELIVVPKDVFGPTPEEVRLLAAHPGAPAAACEIHRKYRKAAAAFVTFSCVPKKFRVDDQQLREWLVPKKQALVEYGKPSMAFLAAAKRSPSLFLHPAALDDADSLVENRWEFATRAANLLAEYSEGKARGALREWNATHGVDFAANGRVSYKFQATNGAEVRESKSEWHLKEGDATSRANAARIYFARIEFSAGVRLVVVFYVGPHPPDGERSVSIDVG